ncbi:MAG: retropepsin-like aspartic protease, partial [Nitrososphaerales archaeon]
TQEKLQLQAPYEDVIASIHNADRWTAAFTITRIHNKPTRTLADTGASHSVISLNWLKYLKLERFIQKEEMSMVSAQKQAITVVGTIAITVLFGNKEFEWVVRVAPELICPLILGIDILNDGGVNCKERFVEISGQRQPITITLGELGQSTVLAATNKVIQPFHSLEMNGKVIKDNNAQIASLQEDTYILNGGGIVERDQLVKSKKCKAVGATGVSEYVPIRLFNSTSKKMIIRKGTILATAELLDVETVNAIQEYTWNKAISNHNILSAVFSPNADMGGSREQSHLPSSNPVTQENAIAKGTAQQQCSESVTCQSLNTRVVVDDPISYLNREGMDVHIPRFMVEQKFFPTTTTIDCADIGDTPKEIRGQQAAQSNVEVPRIDSRLASFMPLRVGLRDNNAVQMEGGGDLGLASLMPLGVAHSTFKDNWYQQCEPSEVGEQGCLKGSSPKENSWAQEGVNGVGRPEETLCATESEVPTPTVSELRQEVLSFQFHKQQVQEINALYETLSMSNQAAPESVNYMDSEGSEGTPYVQKQEKVKNNTTNLQHLSSSLDKDKGTVNVQDCMKEIKEMVAKAECTKNERTDLEILFYEVKAQL